MREVVLFTRVIKGFRELGVYLWSGWGAGTGVFLFFAFWDWGSQIYGGFILPSPQDSIRMLVQFFERGIALEELWVSGYRALAGFLGALFFGSLGGILAGFSMTLSMVLRPLVSVMLGVPPISWIVLALLWFETVDIAPIFTVGVTALPIIFANAMQGMRTLNNDLSEMAKSYHLPWWMMFTDVYLPHLLSYLFPAWITAMGISWKVVVMAELLSTDNGVGAAIATARVNLETVQTMAWIIAIVTMIMLLETLILNPIQKKMEHWKHQ